jgi:hypothetical protein
LEDHTLLGVVAIVGLVVVWTVNCLTLRLDSNIATAVVSSITGVVAYIVGFKRGRVKGSAK